MFCSERTTAINLKHVISSLRSLDCDGGRRYKSINELFNLKLFTYFTVNSVDWLVLVTAQYVLFRKNHCN